MKGLVTKDIFMIAKYFKLYFLMDVIFIAVAFFSPDSSSFLMIPVLLSGIIPITLLAYDERSHWTEYSGALPYSKAQIVSAKYLIGLLLLAVMCAVLFTVLLITGAHYGHFDPTGSAVTVLVMFVIALLFPAVCLPFCFAFGTEKGRIVYMLMIGAVTAAVILLNRANAPDDIAAQDLAVTNIPPIFLAIITVIYALSWLASIAICNKKETGKV